MKNQTSTHFDHASPIFSNMQFYNNLIVVRYLFKINLMISIDQTNSYAMGEDGNTILDQSILNLVALCNRLCLNLWSNEYA